MLQHLFHLDIFLSCPFPEENGNASIFDCSKPYGQETNTHYFCPLYFLNFIKELLVWQNVYSQCILMCKQPALVMSDLRTWWILIWMFQAYDLDKHRTEAYIHADIHIREGTEPNKLCDWSNFANTTTLEFLNPSTQMQAMAAAQYVTYCCAVELRLHETWGAEFESESVWRYITNGIPWSTTRFYPSLKWWEFSGILISYENSVHNRSRRHQVVPHPLCLQHMKM